MVVSGARNVRDSVGSAMFTTLMSSVAMTVPSASTGNTRQRGNERAPPASPRGGALSLMPSALRGRARDLGKGGPLAVHQRADGEKARGPHQSEPPSGSEQRDRNADLPQRPRRALSRQPHHHSGRGSGR